MKILNCITNSFFRTIGRVLAYLAIGALLVALLSKAKLPSLDSIVNDTLFMKVNASELVESVKYSATDYITSNSNYATTDSGYIIPVNPQSGIQRYQIDFSPMINAINYDYIQFQVLVSQPNSVTYSYQNELDLCDRWNWGSIDSNNQVTRWDCAKYSSNPQTFKYVKQTEITNYNFNMFVNYADESGHDSGWSMCSQQDNQFFCPTYHKRINFVGFFVNYETNLNVNVNFIFFRGVSFYNYDNSIGNAINTQTNTITNNQNQNTQEVINNQNANTNKTLEEINNTNGTAQDDADNFFSNFSTADQGGLSGIITAPLSAIQSLTSSTCSPLVIPLPYIDENLTLPCMRSIYESFFGNFMVLYDTITIGIISYWVIVRLFNLVKDFKNPEHDEIEVLDL